MIDSIVDYKSRAILARDRNENIDIPNSTLEHAIFLSDLLFEHAKKDVKILTGSLSELFYNDSLINIFEKLIRKGIRIRVIVWHKIANINFLETLKKRIGQKVEIKEVNIENKPENYVKHFAVVDDVAYRLENVHFPEAEVKEAYQIKGIVNFNNAKTASILSGTFDNTWKKLSR